MLEKRAPSENYAQNFFIKIGSDILKHVGFHIQKIKIF